MKPFLVHSIERQYVNDEDFMSLVHFYEEREIIEQEDYLYHLILFYTLSHIPTI